MPPSAKATKISLLDFKSPQMRAFHMSWFAFFICFFGWFGIAPLMAVVREDLNLTKEQVGNTIIASVAITILMRLLIGWLCDRFGARRTYSVLMVIGSIPVMCIGLANSYETFLLFRLAIGGIGASFVITQYHTSMMFAPNVVGTANATTAGWGNMGGGVTQIVMPVLLSGVLLFVSDAYLGWRIAMVIPGLMILAVGIAYYFLTQDTPEGNFDSSRNRSKDGGETDATFLSACKDPRVWMLFFAYAACFGVELTINNIAAIYYADTFGLSITVAGVVAGLFGLMNIFARSLGGFFGDRFGARWGFNGRVRWLVIALGLEAVALAVFSQMTMLPLAIGTMVVFSLFVQMSEGATFSVVPFINRKAMGSVAGIVGAGGNAGAVGAGFLLRAEGMTYSQALLIMSALVGAASMMSMFVRVRPATADEPEAVAAELDADTAEV